MRVAFCYNIKKGDPSLDPEKQEDIEFDSPEVINDIKEALQNLGHSVIEIQADLSAYDKLREKKDEIDIVFTIAEGLGGDAREAQIALFCEMLGIPYTHSTPTVHALGLNKQLTKLVLKSSGIKIPESVVIEKIPESFDFDLNFPLIIKPNLEGSSKGIYDKNVVRDKNDLKERLIFMIRNFGSCIVEEYIDGREFTVALIGAEPKVLPIVEQKFGFLPQGFNKIASYELKWLYEDTLKDPHDAYDCPAILSDEIKKEIEDTSIKIFKTLGVRDCARIDYRMDKNNKLYFLEINTLPGLNFDESIISYLPLASRAAGMKKEDVVNEILNSALNRFKN